MKRILFISAFVPSKKAAGENFSRLLIRDLAVGNWVDLIYFKYNKDNETLVNQPNTTVVRVFKNSIFIKIMNSLLFPVLFPLFTVRFNFYRLAVIRKTIRKGNYDFVIFNFSQTFLFSRFVKCQNQILIVHDIISQRYSRVYSGLLKPFCKQSEKFIFWRNPGRLFTFSEKDRVLLKNMYSRNSSVENFYIDNAAREAYPEHEGDYFVFFANWQRPDNSNGLRLFLRESIPLMTNCPDIKIIGTGLPQDIQNKILHHPEIVYLGFVENPYQIIANSKALIAPILSGAGVKVKVLESFACGAPVIGLPITFEGISEKYSAFMILSEDFKDIAQNMTNFNIELDRKIRFKGMFLETYKAGAILNYINQ